MVPMLTQPDQKDLNVMKELLESGRVTSVMDRSYALSEVAEAIRYVAHGHARGKVVITV
jgi:NADPH:quinone reductase-like Zn-dependent oxidoreductase